MEVIIEEMGLGISLSFQSISREGLYLKFKIILLVKSNLLIQKFLSYLIELWQILPYILNLH